MLDYEWLSGIRCTMPSGHRIIGFQGHGSDKVVFRTVASDGEELVFKTFVTRLGLHIREIPLDFSGTPMYDVGRLNQKLDRLTGEARVDQMTHDYNRLFSGMMAAVHRLGLIKVLSSTKDPRTAEALAFLLCSAPFAARLHDFYEMGESGVDTREVVSVNGPSFPFSDSRFGLQEFSGNTSQGLESIRPIVNDACPDKLPYNPLYVWGAAITDGFFTDVEMPLACEYIEQRYGSLVKHPDSIIWLIQMDMIAHLMARYLEESHVSRLIQFCQIAGFIFET